MDLSNHSDDYDYLFFRMLNDYSYNFIKIGLLNCIFWNYIIHLYILIFP